VQRFAVGSTVAERHVLDGRLQSALPGRVLADDGHSLTLARWPGARCLVNGEWVTAMESGRQEDRDAALVALGRGDWKVVPFTWHTTAVVNMLEASRWFSVHRFHDSESGALLCWYVNFQRPYARADGGIDTLDLIVDLVVGPDLGWAWKDEQEYAGARRLGLVTEDDHRSVTAARDEALALVEAVEPPFSADPPTWLPSPDWPVPMLRG
jgi:predicted RNA-binding protein associated with RNAse of E/G family